MEPKAPPSCARKRLPSIADDAIGGFAIGHDGDDDDDDSDDDVGVAAWQASGDTFYPRSAKQAL
jgi:hypothetical protein